MKTCKKCGAQHDKSHPYCPPCHNEYQKAWYKANPKSVYASSRRRVKAIRDLVKAAKDVPCADCKNSYPYYVMDLDHVRGEKKFELSRAGSSIRKLELVQEEIDKCDVVCANCHRIRTFTNTRGSSNGKTPDFGSGHEGSNPSPRTDGET